MKRFAWFFILFVTFAGFAFAPRAYAILPSTTGESVADQVNKCTTAHCTNKGWYSADSIHTYAWITVGDTSGLPSTDPNNIFGYDKSAVASIGNTITAMYTNPPADLALWIRDTGQTLGFIPKQAYAQGIGFTGLSALLPLWKVFRNIAYFLLAIVMVVIGFMVMLRKKIDPKTVVTVQNAIPKIVLSLLLITFSYAIVGLMIDLMYLMIFLLIGLFQSAKLLPDPSAAAKLFSYSTNQPLYSQGGIIPNVANIFGIPAPITGGVGGVTSPLNLLYQALGFEPKAAAGVSVVSGFLGIGLALGTGSPWGLLAALPAGLSVVFALLLSIALLFLVIRLLIFFLTAYIQIIFALIFAPIQLVMEALPGSTAFSDWIKNLFANLIVFPIGAGAFMLSAMFANMANNPNAQLWTPPFATLVPSSTRSIAALVAIGILFAIPTIAGGIKEALKAKPFLAAGPEGIVGSFGQPVNLAMQGYQMWVSHRSMEAFSKMAGGKTEKTEG